MGMGKMGHNRSKSADLKPSGTTLSGNCEESKRRLSAPNHFCSPTGSFSPHLNARIFSLKTYRPRKKLTLAASVLANEVTIVPPNTPPNTAGEITGNTNPMGKNSSVIVIFSAMNNPTYTANTVHAGYDCNWSKYPLNSLLGGNPKNSVNSSNPPTACNAATLGRNNLSTTPAIATFTALDINGAASRTASDSINALDRALQYSPTAPGIAFTARSRISSLSAVHVSPGSGRRLASSSADNNATASIDVSSRRGLYFTSFHKPFKMSPVGFRLFFFCVVDGPSGAFDDDASGRDSRALRLLDRPAATTVVQRVGVVVVSVIVF